MDVYIYTHIYTNKHTYIYIHVYTYILNMCIRDPCLPEPKYNMKKTDTRWPSSDVRDTRTTISRSLGSKKTGQ